MNYDELQHSTSISFMSDQSTAKITTNDPALTTRLEMYCQRNPKNFTCVSSFGMVGGRNFSKVFIVPKTALGLCGTPIY